MPVIVYVSPSGGRAASAGTFITMAAPGRGHGAEHDDRRRLADQLGRQRHRRHAGQEGRRTTPSPTSAASPSCAAATPTGPSRPCVTPWPSTRTRRSSSTWSTSWRRASTTCWRSRTAAASRCRTQTASCSDVTLCRSPARRSHENNPNIFEELLYVIADPNIAFLLLSLGGLALVVEMFHPSGLTGIFGAIALVLAFFALGSLPTNWAGVALIVVRLRADRRRDLRLRLRRCSASAASLRCLRRPDPHRQQRGRLPGLALAGHRHGSDRRRAACWASLGILVRARRMPRTPGRESLVGTKGTDALDARPHAAPCWCSGERWDAIAEDPPHRRRTRRSSLPLGGLPAPRQARPGFDQAATRGRRRLRGDSPLTADQILAWRTSICASSSAPRRSASGRSSATCRARPLDGRRAKPRDHERADERRRRRNRGDQRALRPAAGQGPMRITAWEPPLPLRRGARRAVQRHRLLHRRAGAAAAASSPGSRTSSRRWAPLGELGFSLVVGPHLRVFGRSMDNVRRLAEES